MVTCNETNASISALLSEQIVGNVCYIIFGFFGIIGNSIIIVIYMHCLEFRHKTFLLLGLLAFADGIVSIVIFGVGLLRTLEYWLNFSVQFSTLECMQTLTPFLIGYSASITIDFTIALDRLIAVTFPTYHAHKLGWKYIISLVVIGWTRPIIDTIGHYIKLKNLPIPICTLQDNNMRNVYYKYGDYLSMLTVGGTIALYFAVVCLIRRKVRDASSSCKKLLMDGWQIINGEAKYFKMCRDVERRLIRVAIVTALCFLFTNVPALIATEVIDYLRPCGGGTAPYVFMFLEFNSCDNILISIIRDPVFRTKLVNACKLVWLKATCRQQLAFEVRRPEHIIFQDGAFFDNGQLPVCSLTITDFDSHLPRWSFYHSLNYSFSFQSQSSDHDHT